MMLGSAAASWLFTIVFGAAALGASLPLTRRARRPRPAGRAAAGFCVAMCAALIAMTWRAEPAPAVWLQVAVFGATALWLVFAGPVWAGLHHVLMAAAMSWMLTAIPARVPAAGMAGMGMAGAMPSVAVLAVSGLFAACCVATSIPWVTQAIGGPGLRLTDPRAASQAAMTVGMAAMLIVML